MTRQDTDQGTLQTGNPETSIESKRVAIRAEHSDTIRVDSLGECEVVQRLQTYYGPKLRIEPVDEDEQYRITAPGPLSELQLWELEDDGWRATREVSAELVDVKQYDICPDCGEPLKTIAHERRAAIGACGT